MKTFLAILTLTALSLPSLRAQDAPVVVELKNKSSFTIDASGRNPFWPIGWKPVARAQNSATEHTGPDILPSAFVVTCAQASPQSS